MSGDMYVIENNNEYYGMNMKIKNTNENTTQYNLQIPGTLDGVLMGYSNLSDKDEVWNTPTEDLILNTQNLNINLNSKLEFDQITNKLVINSNEITTDTITKIDISYNSLSNISNKNYFYVESFKRRQYARGWTNNTINLITYTNTFYKNDLYHVLHSDSLGLDKGRYILNTPNMTDGNFWVIEDFDLSGTTDIIRSYRFDGIFSQNPPWLNGSFTERNPTLLVPNTVENINFYVNNTEGFVFCVKIDSVTQILSSDNNEITIRLSSISGIYNRGFNKTFEYGFKTNTDVFVKTGTILLYDDTNSRIFSSNHILHPSRNYLFNGSLINNTNAQYKWLYKNNDIVNIFKDVQIDSLNSLYLTNFNETYLNVKVTTNPTGGTFDISNSELHIRRSSLVFNSGGSPWTPATLTNTSKVPSELLTINKYIWLDKNNYLKYDNKNVALTNISYDLDYNKEIVSNTLSSISKIPKILTSSGLDRPQAFSFMGLI